MIGAFLAGAAYAAGVCLVLAVTVLVVVTVVVARDKAMAKRRYQQVISEAVGGLGDEDIEALLRGDEGGIR